jgi:hypothetical protein
MRRRSARTAAAGERLASRGPTVPVAAGPANRVQQLLHLQSAIGNRAFTRSLERQASSPAEREARDIANDLTSEGGPRRAPAPTRKGGPEAPPRFRSEVARGGSPLPDGVRQHLESDFGTGLGHVRIHADQRAQRTTENLGARAVTVGSDIMFAPGRYDPGNPAGDRLLAHEVTHAVQQSSGPATVQCDPDPKAKKKPSKDKSDAKGVAPAIDASGLELPWEFGDYTFYETTSSGIQFLVGIDREKRKEIESAIPAIAKRMAADNALIKDPASQVRTCIIAPTTTRYAHWNGVPVLMLDPSNAQAPTAAHEMGHGVFHYLKGRGASKEKDSAGAAAFRLKIGDIYARLSATKEIEIDEKKVAAGLWIADPSQWSPGSPHEHPWQDPDEFFASAKSAFQTDRKGLEAAIAKFSKVDPAVAAPARELIALLEEFLGKGKLPKSSGLSEDRKKTAEAELGRESGVSKVEDTLGALSTLLSYLLDPSTRPKRKKSKPSLERP